MKSIGIITDSHSSISQQTARELGITVFPMPFYIDGQCFYEDVTLTREQFFEKLDSGADISTSQPSPAEVMALWNQGLKEYETILYFPLSSGLSGSCATAAALAQDEPYENRVFVVDNGRVSTPMHRSILDALELIKEGYTAPEIKKIIEAAREDMVIYIGVQTLEHLKKGGRITPTAAALGTILNIKPVLKLDVGTLDAFKKCRGFAKAKKTMIEAIRHDLNTRFQEAYEKGEITLMAASSASPEDTAQWVAEIQEAFPDLDVMCDDLSLGVSCHIGYGGLGIGVACRPKRPII
ncbi:MAG: DegV family protein [Lachnospiraceae bacterium]|nr:DegV family protein [Lachnospiraceae bacterium]